MKLRYVPLAMGMCALTTAASAALVVTQPHYFLNGERVTEKNANSTVDPFGTRQLSETMSFSIAAVPPAGYKLDEWLLWDGSLWTGSTLDSIDRTLIARRYYGYKIDVTWNDAEFSNWRNYTFYLSPCFSWLSYELRFNPNWSGHPDDDQSLAQTGIVYTNAVELKAFTDAEAWTRANHRLAGLSLSPDASDADFQFGGTVADAGEAFGVTTNGVATLYGVWAPRRVTLSLDADGGSVASNAVYVVGDERCPALPAPTKDGFFFEGWFDATNRPFSEGVEVVAADGETIGLKARWISAASTVVLTARGGETGDTSIDILFDERLPLADMPTRQGYDFAGYFSKAGGEGVMYYDAAGTPVNTVSKDDDIKEFFACWTAKRSVVTLDAAGGEGGTSEVVAEYDASLPAITPPTRKGYGFEGYFTFTAGGRCYYSAGGSSVDTWKKASPATLYAHWKAIEYNVDYDYAGGVPGDYQPTKATFGIPFAAGVPRKAGFRFAGYVVSGDLDAESARCGSSFESATGAVSSTTKCKGADGAPYVYFADLCSKDGGTVLLKAQWESASSSPLSMSSSTKTANRQSLASSKLAAAPGRGLVGSVNVADAKTATDCNFELTDVFTYDHSQWHEDTAVFVKGTSALRYSCTYIGDLAMHGYIEGKVNGPGTLTFQWRSDTDMSGVSDNNSGFRFYYNDGEQVDVSTRPLKDVWENVTVVITNAGDTTFDWMAYDYETDYNVWLDDIHWEPAVLEVSPSSYTNEYTGEGLGVTNVQVSYLGSQEIPTSVQYALSEAGPFGVDPILFTNVVTTSIWCRVEVDGKGSVTNEIAVTISKAANCWTVAPHIDAKWQEGVGPKSITNGVARFGETEVYYCNKTNGSERVDGLPGATTPEGEYTAVFSVEGTANWSAIATNIDFAVTGAPVEPEPAEPAELHVVKEPDPVVCVYDGKGHGIANQLEIATTNDVAVAATVRYGLSSDGPFYEYSDLFTNAVENGTAWYSVTADGYVGVTNSVSVTISKASNEWTELPAVADWTAGDEAAVGLGKAKYGEVVVKYSTGGSEPPTEYGEYTVEISSPGTDNWSGLSTNMTFRVRAIPVFHAVAIDCEGTYDGSGHGIEVVYDNAGVGSATVKYALSKDGPYQSENVTFVDAMAEPATVWFVVEAKGYDAVTNSGTVMIHKAKNGWLSGPSISGWKFGDTPHVGAASSEFGAVSVAYDTNGVPCTATFSVAESANWLGLSTNVEFNVEGMPPPPDGGGESGGGDSGGGQGGDNPGPGPAPEPFVSGVASVAFAKAQTVSGALYFADGTLAGAVQLKFGRVNAKKREVKVSGTALLLTGKKASAKSTKLKLGDGGMSGPLVFKAPVGAMNLSMDENGVFVLAGDGCFMKKADVGGALPGVSSGSFDLADDFDLNTAGELQRDLLPMTLVFGVSGGRWHLPKNASVKLKKDKATGEFDRVVDLGKDGSKSNVASLKLSYAAKTGVFKGSFKAFAIEGVNGRPKLKKHTVNVYGFVIDGEGVGVATSKKPAGGPWDVSVDLK